MKKIFYVITAASMLYACSSDEATEFGTVLPKSKMITYETSVATRAEVSTINNLDSFYVTSYLKQNDVISRYISDMKVKYTDGLWKPEQENAWPHSGTMTFFTCSPRSERIAYNFPAISNNELTTPTFTYSVPSSEENQLDVLYAVTNKDCADAYNANPENGNSESVNINFRHALSQIALRAENTNPDWRVKITKVTLHNVKHAGTYTFPTQTTQAGNTVRGSWDIEDSKADYQFTFSDVIINGKQTVDLASSTKKNSLLLMPQTTTAWNVTDDKSNDLKGAYFTITCNIVHVKEGVEVQLWPRIDKYEFGATKNVAIPANVDWVEGKCYTYNIQFGDGAGYIPPGETDGGSLIDGSNTLKAIKYSVTVSSMDNEVVY